MRNRQAARSIYCRRITQLLRITPLLSITHYFESPVISYRLQLSVSKCTVRAIYLKSSLRVYPTVSPHNPQLMQCILPHPMAKDV
jgi:hypothetical protein